MATLFFTLCCYLNVFPFLSTVSHFVSVWLNNSEEKVYFHPLSILLCLILFRSPSWTGRQSIAGPAETHSH